MVMAYIMKACPSKKEQDDELPRENCIILVSIGNNTMRGTKFTELLGRKLNVFLSIGNHVKPQKERTPPPLHRFAYQKESECLCD